MSNPKIILSFEDLYDKVKNDNPDFMDEKEFQLIIDDLITDNIIQTNISNDIIYYSVSPQLKRSDLIMINDSIKMSIILLLIDNNNTFFVYLNTQKGKMKIAAKEIKSWGQDKLHKVVAIMVTDNDKTLTDQSVDGIKKTFENENQPVKLFTLSSNSATKFDDIKIYIDAYANSDDTDEYPMPLIVSLANPKQGEKIVKILNHINKKIERINSKLRYSPLFDEADKTYPPLRDRPYIIDGEKKTFASFVLEHSKGLYRLGFVSATEGCLLDEFDYPECANAQQYPVEISEEDQKDYRALHHPESIIHRIPYSSKQTHNEYAKQILETHKQHFITPIELLSGERYYRKIIVNSNARTEDMREFARWCNTKQMNALVFNGYGGASVKIYKPDMNGIAIKTKGRELREVLMYVYKKYELDDKPIVIIGRRKVDRGLGFHYCPRKDEEILIKDMGMGDLIIRNRESLIWTDIILGRIEDKNTAVQKAGRGAGIIGSSPQYPGHIHYWTDEDTANIIYRHNTIVDITNNSVSISISHAVKNAENIVPIIQINHRVPNDKFLVYTDEDIVREVCRRLKYRYNTKKPNEDGFILTSLNKKAEIASLIDAINKVPTSYGSNRDAYRTCLHCYKDKNDKDTLHFVIPLIRPGIDNNILQKIKEDYPPIEIPQEGPF